MKCHIVYFSSSDGEIIIGVASSKEKIDHVILNYMKERSEDYEDKLESFPELKIENIKQLKKKWHKSMDEEFYSNEYELV